MKKIEKMFVWPVVAVLCIGAEALEFAMAQHKTLVCVQVQQGKLAPLQYKCTSSGELF